MNFRKDKADAVQRLEGVLQDLTPQEVETIKDVLVDYIKANYFRYGLIQKPDLELNDGLFKNPVKFKMLDTVKLRGHPRDVLLAGIALALAAKKITPADLKKIMDGE